MIAVRRIRLTAIRIAVVVLFWSTVPAYLHAQIEITLKNDFIEKYRNRASIDSNFTVDIAHKRPNPPSKDGDMHIAGRDEAIGLPIVAEIMNAKFSKPAVDKIHEVEGSEEPIELTGAWRIWTEHGGLGAQVQGKPLRSCFKTRRSNVAIDSHR
jgi:hypothetical protein